MKSLQELLDHCQHYFKSRIDNYGGKTFSGWGIASRPGIEARCALGSLVLYPCASIRTEVEKIIGDGTYDSWSSESFYRTITAFNDSHAVDNNRLTIDKVNTFLSSLALKNNLIYNPILEKISNQALEKEVL